MGILENVSNREQLNQFFTQPVDGEKGRVSSPKGRGKRNHRAVRGVAIGLIVLIGLLVIARIYLPFWVRDYVNRTLDKIPGYHGEVQAVGIHLWRGAYTIYNVRVVKTDGKVPVPFFAAKTVDLSVQWKAIFNRSFVGEISINNAQLNFVAAKSEENQTLYIDPIWLQQVKKLFPLKINHLYVRNSEVNFRNFSTNPKVDLKMDDFTLEATNLQNTEKLSKNLVSNAHITARAFKTGHLTVDSDFNILVTPPDFSLNLKLLGVDLPELNKFFKAYANFTLKSGSFDLVAQVKAKNGQLEGYFKPLMDHLQVDLDKSSDPIDFVWRGLVSTFTGLFQNQNKGRFATEIPITGTLKAPQEDLFAALLNIFKNAFVQVFVPEFDKTFKVGITDKDKAGEKPKESAPKKDSH